MTRIVGVDVGGTFTDLIMIESDGDRRSIRVAKVPTTADNQALWRHAGDRGGQGEPAEPRPRRSMALRPRPTRSRAQDRDGRPHHHAGFRDTLELGRRTRPKPYGLFGTFEPLIPRERRLEVTERVSAPGRSSRRLTRRRCAAAARALLEAGCEALVIHFLHSYANPAHELRAGADRARLWPNDYVTLGPRAAVGVSRIRARHHRFGERRRAADPRPLYRAACRASSRRAAFGATCW